MDLGLRGKVALVTGANRGIGLAIAMGLAREGCALAICARSGDTLAAAAERIEALGVRVAAIPPTSCCRPTRSGSWRRRRPNWAASTSWSTTRE